MDECTSSSNADLIIEGLKDLEYPMKIQNKEDFLENLMSPSNIRTSTFDWLLSSFKIGDMSLIEKYQMILENFDKTEIFFIVIKNLGIDFEKTFSDSDLKKAIAGLASNSDSFIVLLNLINFVKLYRSIYSNDTCESVNIKKHLNSTVKLINYISDNKLSIFKENIRLFAPEIKLLSRKMEESENSLSSNSNTNSINKKELEERIKGYTNTMQKLDKKLNKLQRLNLDYEYVEMDDLIELKQQLINFDKLLDNFIKDFNQIYSQEIKYISEDKISKLHLSVEKFTERYEELLDLSSTLEEIFAMHSRISNFSI